MTEYCQAGDKPRVEYTFGNGNKRIYQSKVAPIEVIKEKVAASELNGNYNPVGFEINYASGDKQVVINYRTRTVSGATQIQFWSCGSDDWDNRQPDGTYPVWYAVSTPIVSINRAVNCPLPYPPGDCAIRVKYQGETLFFEKGKCPLEYKVACGNCPAGQCECKIDVYPGYCCMDCQQVALKINNMASKAGGCC